MIQFVVPYTLSRAPWGVTFPTFDFGSRELTIPKKGHVCRNCQCYNQRCFSRWWQLFFFLMFIPVWGNDPNLTSIFFKGVETTNQLEDVSGGSGWKCGDLKGTPPKSKSPRGHKPKLPVSQPLEDFNSSPLRIYGGFNYLFIFIPVWGRFPFWLICFNSVETTS